MAADPRFESEQANQVTRLSVTRTGQWPRLTPVQLNSYLTDTHPQARGQHPRNSVQEQSRSAGAVDSLS